MINIAVMGYGTVGSGVVEVIDTNGERIAQRIGDALNVKYVLDIRDFPEDPIQEKIIHDFETIISDDEIQIVVEVMGGIEPAYTFVKRSLLAGKSVVTSNKALVAKHGAELLSIAKEKNINFLFEASVGGGIPISVGAAFGTKYKGGKNVTVCFFGDGASNEGTFHESINFASVMHLPVIFVCENNQWAISTSVKKSCNVENISSRAVGYGIEGITVNGNDVEEVYTKFGEAVEKVRAGGGPILMEMKTYRMAGHYFGDNENYRSREEVNAWKEKCPIRHVKNILMVDFGVTEEELDAIEKEERKIVLVASEEAKADPEPAAEDLRNDLYTDTFAEIEWKPFVK